MKLVLRDYSEDELISVSQDYDPKELDLEFVDLKYTDKLRLEGQVLKSSESLHFWGELNAPVERICGRCVIPVKDKIDQPFDLYYEIKGLEEIETLDDLRETLIVDHPVQYVCRQSCKGLCPQCGANLNEKACRCKIQDEISGPLSKLGEFFKKKNSNNL